MLSTIPRELTRLTSFEQLLLLLHIAEFPMVNRGVATGFGRDVYERSNSIFNSPKKLKGFITEEELSSERMDGDLFMHLHYLVNGNLQLPEPKNVRFSSVSIDVQLGLKELFEEQLGLSLRDNLKGTSVKINPLTSEEPRVSNHVGEVFINQHVNNMDRSSEYIVLDLYNYERVLITHRENPIFDIKEHKRTFDTWKDHRFFWMVGTSHQDSEIYKYYKSIGYSHYEILNIFGECTASLEEAKNRILLNEEIFVSSSIFMKSIGGSRLRSDDLERGMRRVAGQNTVKFRFPKSDLAATCWPFVAKAVLTAILNKKFKFHVDA